MPTDLMAPLEGSTYTCVYLPQRELLSLRSVLALPKASRTGFDSRTLSSSAFAPPRGVPASSKRRFERYDRYRRMNLHVSVLPEPDSPEITNDCDARSRSSARSACSAMTNGCGAAPLNAASAAAAPAMRSSP